MATKNLLLSLLLITAFVYSSAKAVTDFLGGGFVPVKKTGEEFEELNE